MSITTKTRKILWGRSGSRCAMCRCEIVKEKSPQDPEAIVGDECHIISKQDNGPRSYLKIPTSIDLDGYDNLLLLCKTHHKLVDDQPNKYNVEVLRKIKLNHEAWVRESLNRDKVQFQHKNESQGVTLLPRVNSGKDLVNIVKGAHIYRLGNDELETENEMEILSNFAQWLQDYGDLLLDLDISESVKAGFQLSQELRVLEEIGFFVFGERREEQLKIGGRTDDWEVATIYILRETNPAIIDMSKLESSKNEPQNN